MGDQDGKIENFDTIMCTEEVKEKLLQNVRDTGLDLFGIKVFTIHDSILKGMKTKEGGAVNMILVNKGKLFPVGNFKPCEPHRVVAWKQSYTRAEITSMRCEIVALNKKMCPVDRSWRIPYYTDKIRYDALRQCLALLGFWYCGGDVFEETDGTNVL